MFLIFELLAIQNATGKLQIWGIPVGSQSTSLMDVSGVFRGMLDKKEK